MSLGDELRQRVRHALYTGDAITSKMDVLYFGLEEWKNDILIFALDSNVETAIPLVDGMQRDVQILIEKHSAIQEKLSEYLRTIGGFS